MNKIARELKGNKYTIIAIVIFIALLGLGFGLYKYMFPNIGKPTYGNRLDGIEEVMPSEKDFQDLKEALEKESIVLNFSSSVSGKTLNFVVKVKTGTKVANAKKLCDTIASKFSKEQKEYFDLQVFLVNENEKEAGYPIIGYMEKKESKFSFSRG